MLKNYRNSTFVAALVASMFLLGSCEKELDSGMSASSINEAKAAAETAQSIMVDIQVDAPVIEGSETWTFDSNAAADYFTGGTAQNRNSAVQSQKCTFYNGGVLEAKKFGQVWVVPVSEEPVAAKTAWNSSSSDGGSTSDVTVDITIAGQSVVVNKDRAKYSFTLLDEEGNARISDLKVMVSGQDEVSPALEVEVGDEANDCLTDIFYAANAGTFGHATSSLLTDMTMGEIIASNAFGSTSACGNASISKVEQLNYNLAAGSYTITVTGVVKGNAGAASTPFEVTKSVTVGECN
jgi:hypothetical protein